MALTRPRAALFGDTGAAGGTITGAYSAKRLDQGHANGQLISLAMLAEALWKQGMDIYSDYDNRLLAAKSVSKDFA
jgi:hypothetical protein